VKARDIEMLRIMSVNVESVDFDDESSILNAIRTKVEEHEHIVNTNSDVKHEVERLTLELKQSKADLGVSLYFAELVLFGFAVSIFCVTKLLVRIFICASVCPGKIRGKGQRF